MPEIRSRRACVLGALVWSHLAACSSVPEVVFVDPDSSASTRDGGDPGDASVDPAPADAAVPTDAGCVVGKDDVCCGASVCAKKDCQGNDLRCSACALACGGRRCCDRPVGLECVELDQKCGP